MPRRLEFAPWSGDDDPADLKDAQKRFGPHSNRTRCDCAMPDTGKLIPRWRQTMYGIDVEEDNNEVPE